MQIRTTILRAPRFFSLNSIVEEILLINENDEVTGKAEKLLVHRNGWLHRAFSVFIFNSRGELLIQQRADSKYHSPGLWTNACCSHQLEGKTIEQCANDRLSFEMGITCPLSFQFKFHYQAQLDQDMTENEIDYVFFGCTDELPVINQDEVKDWRFVNPVDVQHDLNENPDIYTVWFGIVLNRVLEQIRMNPEP